MLDFKAITDETVPLLRGYYANCEYRLCEYGAGTKYMWREVLEPMWAETAGCLVIRNRMEGHIVFDYPVAGPGGDEEAALESIEADCTARGIEAVFAVVPEEKAQLLLRRYPRAAVSNMRTWKDYLYRAEDLQNFAGRRYSGQRNHINKFHAVCPNAVFRALTSSDFRTVEAFERDFEGEFFKRDDLKAVRELSYAWEMLSPGNLEYFRCGGMFDGDRLIALALAEKCGSTLLVHIEKALYSYEGVYPALVQAFAREFGADVTWINREDDAAERGLRISKLQYEPALLGDKYRFEPKRDYLAHVAELPVLQTRRLTLTALTQADIPAYNALILDRERNRWWGYDDVGSLREPMEEQSFFNVAAADFRRREAANFAVRLDGRLIGEAVLYNFNYLGEGELGCRIAREYAGHGYGTEAFAAAADWALYKVRLTRVRAKCFHENGASHRMLSACMQSAGQDETFDYFTREV